MVHQEPNVLLCHYTLSTFACSEALCVLDKKVDGVVLPGS